MATFPVGTKLNDITGAFNRGTKVRFTCPDHLANEYSSKEPGRSAIFITNGGPFGEPNEPECKCPLRDHVLIAEYKSIDY